MFGFSFVYAAWSIVLIKRLLAYLYLWQKKEYRVDKIMDYLNLPESKKFLWDRFTKSYFFLFIVFISLYTCFSYRLVSTSLLLTLGIAVILFSYIVYITDTVVSIVKTIRKSLLYPVFSPKMSLIFIISLGLYTWILLNIMAQPVAIAALYQLIVVLTIPFVIFMVSLLIKPLEIYKKNQTLARAKHRRSQLKNLKVIAISGSYGKTTTKDILYQLLATKYKVTKTQKNHNTTISLARQMIQIKDDTEIFIAEVGAYLKGDGSDACAFLQPTSSIITGLNNQHFSLFGSEQNIIEAESESLAFLPQDGPAYINFDSELCHKIEIPKKIKLTKYGLNGGKLDVKASNTTVKDKITAFDLNIGGKSHPVQTNLISDGNIQNLTGALALCLDLGIKMQDIQDTLLNFDQTPSTLEVIEKPWGNLINDSYNSNIDGVTNAISLLNQKKGKKILVLDDILELGSQAAETHKNLGSAIAKLDLDAVILMGRNYSVDIKKILVADKPVLACFIYDDQKSEVENYIGNITKETDVNILLEGYRSRLFLDKM